MVYHGIGKSLAFKKSRIDKRIFVLLSDGELGEGSNWEAIFFAGYHKLDNITAIIDYNKLQVTHNLRYIRLGPC